MMTFLRFIFCRLDRRPSPIGKLHRPDLLRLHIAQATDRASSPNPFPFAR